MQSLSEVPMQHEAAAFHLRIDLVLATLSEKEREVLTRFYVHEQSADHICKEMGLSADEFRLLKSRAKARFWKGRSPRSKQRRYQDFNPTRTRRDGTLEMGEILPIVARAIAVF